jgi:hypothetical protein
MSYKFNIADFTEDIDAVQQQYPDREGQGGGNLEKWPIDQMGLPKEYTVRLGRGSVRLTDRGADKPGNRTYDVSVSVPAIVDLAGVKYSSFIGWYTGSPIGLKEFAKLLTAFRTDDPAVVAARMQQAVLKGYFKNYHNNGYDNITVSNYTLLEVPKMEETDISQVKVDDRRGGASTSSPAAAPSAPVPTLPGATAAPVLPGTSAAEKPFWEQ